MRSTSTPLKTVAVAETPKGGGIFNGGSLAMAGGKGGVVANAPVRSLSKGLAALDVLRTAGQLRTTDLALQLDIDKGAASRMLQTLARTGYAERLPDRSYRAGAKLRPAEAPAARRVNVRPAAQPLLARLSEQTGEATYLGLLIEDLVLYVDKVVPDATLKVDRPIPTFSPLHCTAIGKVFAAFCDVPLAHDMTAFTAHTIVDPMLFRREIEKVCSLGYACDDEELNPGVRCVAAPMFDRGAVAAVLCLAAPSARRASADLDRMGRLTKHFADQFVLH